MKGVFRNIVGPQIRRLRYNLGWSQDELAVQLQLAGLDLSRESVAKVESQIHNVEDHHLPYYARTLGVAIQELFPPLRLDKPIHDVIVRLRSRIRPKALQIAANATTSSRLLRLDPTRDRRDNQPHRP